MKRPAPRPPHPAFSPPRALPRRLLTRARAVRLLVLDVDGVMTDGRMHYGPRGEALMAFHVLDGHGIKLALAAGLAVAIVSGRASPMLRRRARELGVTELHCPVPDKLAVFTDLLARRGLTAAQAACLGDDLLDLPLLRRAGLAMAVPNGAPEVRAAAHYVTRRGGGEGAVREAVELVLTAQGRWAALVEAHG